MIKCRKWDNTDVIYYNLTWLLICVAEMSDYMDKVDRLKCLVLNMPPPNHDTLKFMCRHLRRWEAGSVHAPDFMGFVWCDHERGPFPRGCRFLSVSGSFGRSAPCANITVVNFGLLWRWKGWRKMNGVRRSASQFLLQYIKCVFSTAYGFSFHSRGERSCSEAGAGARVWWTPWFCQLSLSFSRSPSRVIPLRSFWFSFIITLLHPLSLSSPCLLFLASFLSSFSLPPPSSHPFLSFLLFSSLCLEGPMGALWFVCWKAYRHHRRHHWNLSLFLAHVFFFSLALPSPLSLFPPPLLSFLMWKFWAIAGFFCGLVGTAFLEECLMLWL